MERQRVDRLTIVGLAALLMPLLTMWHEIGGHALSCVAQGGRVTEVGAFYVECRGLAGWPDRIVALAGAGLDAALAAVAYLAWRRARGDLARVVLWYVWVCKAMVAAGYLCFSGAIGYGDLAPGAPGEGLGPIAHPVTFRIGEFLVGVALYVAIVRAAISALTTMVGTGPATGPARRRIAHVFYGTAGVSAVLVGLLNPIGISIAILSAAASSFGGLAGLISIGFALPARGAPRDFAIERNWVIVVAGVAVLALFASILGPTWRPVPI